MNSVSLDPRENLKFRAKFALCPYMFSQTLISIVLCSLLTSPYFTTKTLVIYSPIDRDTTISRKRRTTTSFLRVSVDTTLNCFLLLTGAVRSNLTSPRATIRGRFSNSAIKRNLSLENSSVFIWVHSYSYHPRSINRHYLLMSRWFTVNNHSTWDWHVKMTQRLSDVVNNTSSTVTKLVVPMLGQWYFFILFFLHAFWLKSHPKTNSIFFLKKTNWNIISVCVI